MNFSKIKFKYTKEEFLKPNEDINLNRIINKGRNTAGSLQDYCTDKKLENQFNRTNKNSFPKKMKILEKTNKNKENNNASLEEESNKKQFLFQPSQNNSNATTPIINKIRSIKNLSNKLNLNLQRIYDTKKGKFNDNNNIKNKALQLHTFNMSQKNIIFEYGRNYQLQTNNIINKSKKIIILYKKCKSSQDKAYQFEYENETKNVFDSQYQVEEAKNEAELNNESYIKRKEIKGMKNSSTQAEIFGINSNKSEKNNRIEIDTERMSKAKANIIKRELNSCQNQSQNIFINPKIINSKVQSKLNMINHLKINNLNMPFDKTHQNLVPSSFNVINIDKIFQKSVSYNNLKNALCRNKYVAFPKNRDINEENCESAPFNIANHYSNRTVNKDKLNLPINSSIRSKSLTLRFLEIEDQKSKQNYLLDNNNNYGDEYNNYSKEHMIDITEKSYTNKCQNNSISDNMIKNKNANLYINNMENNNLNISMNELTGKENSYLQKYISNNKNALGHNSEIITKVSYYDNQIDKSEINNKSNNQRKNNQLKKNNYVARDECELDSNLSPW